MTWFVAIDLVTLAILIACVVLYRPLARMQIARFERAYGYDGSYLRFVADASPRAMLRLAGFQLYAGQRRGLPRDAFYAARLAGTMAEDCGPCTQLVVRMAEEEKMSATTLRAVVARDEAAMSDDARLAFRFADAALRHDVVQADALRREVVSRWGEEAVVSLAFGLATSRVYPTMKYALGFGRACSKVQVGGVESPVVRVGEQP